jgi:hypothetical protein
MVRRSTKNRTGLSRISGKPHDARVAYICVNCTALNSFSIGPILLDANATYSSASWVCKKCKFEHSKSAPLPFKHWPKPYKTSGSIHAQRFWLGFFRIATEHRDSYWKWCNTCDRVLPFSAFSKHAKWGPLERQMECRSCKGSINAKLNPRRTTEQLRESSRRRRAAELLLEGINQRISVDALFKRFGSRCFKTGKALDKRDTRSWAIDHILPAAFLYPLSTQNAALLSAEANNNKRDQWPSSFYTNNELVELSKLTGADLTVLASRDPIFNQALDVDACVSRSLTVREKSNLSKRVRELKWILSKYDLVKRLSEQNRRRLGFS